MEILKKFFGATLIILMVSISYSQIKTDVYNAFKTSYTYETSGEYAKAIEEIKKVYKEDSYEINLRLGWLNYSAGYFTLSKSYYQKAVDLMPYSIEAKFGIIYPAAALGNWDQVITHYNKILEIDPKNTTANYRLGLIYYERKEYNKALTYFEQVVNLYPFDYDGLLMFAWTNYMLGNAQKAKILFDKALLLKPDDSSAKEGYDLVK